MQASVAVFYKLLPLGFLGMYFYNGHPIRRVDIMGAVISVKERETFYSYGGKSSHL